MNLNTFIDPELDSLVVFFSLFFFFFLGGGGGGVNRSSTVVTSCVHWESMVKKTKSQYC